MHVQQVEIPEICQRSVKPILSLSARYISNFHMRIYMIHGAFQYRFGQLAKHQEKQYSNIKTTIVFTTDMLKFTV